MDIKYKLQILFYKFLDRTNNYNKDVDDWCTAQLEKGPLDIIIRYSDAGKHLMINGKEFVFYEHSQTLVLRKYYSTMSYVNNFKFCLQYKSFCNKIAAHDKKRAEECLKDYLRY